MPDGAIGWFPVLTLLLGYATKTINDWIHHRRVSEREREARRSLRQDQIFERRVAFQRQTLLELQEAVMELIRCAGAMHHLDEMEHRRTGRWHKQLYEEDLSEQARLANARTTLFAVRVRDDSVRDLVTEMKSHVTASVFSRSPEEGQQELNLMVKTFETLNHRIGEVLRELDDLPATLAE